MIEGHKNLKECAYVGDNSSEENDNDVSSDENRNVSIPSQMTKISPGVVLNYSWKTAGNLSELNVTENESSAKLSKTGEKKLNNVHLKYAENLYLKERKKNTTQSTMSTQAVETTTRPSSTDSAEVLEDVMTKLKALGSKGKQILLKLGTTLNNRTVDVTTDKTPPEDVLNVLDELIKDMYGKNLSLSKTSKKSKINETRTDDEKEEFQKLHNEIMLHRSRISLMDREPNTGQEVRLHKKIWPA